MTILVLQTRAARTRIVSSNLLLHMYWHLGLRLTAIGGQIPMLSLHPGHFLLGRRLCRLLGLTRLPQEDGSPEQERKHILIQCLKHCSEQVVTLYLIDYKRVLLLVGSILHGLAQVIQILSCCFQWSSIW